MINRVLRNILSLLLILFSFLPLSAQDDVQRPVTGIYSLGIGRRSVVARFLAPVTYGGALYSASGRWIKAMPFAPERALMEFVAHVDGAYSLLNPRKNSSMQAVDIEFDWNMRAWWQLPNEFTVSAGGGIELEGGAEALLKNSNNPVNVNIAAALGMAVSGSWTHTFGRLPVVATLSMRSPLLGAFYMPGYGETYFEMYVGNHSGLVHFGWPGNRNKIALNLSVMLDFGRTAMEVGYRMDWQRASANNLVYRAMTNGFTIGVIPGGLGIKKRVAQIRPL